MYSLSIETEPLGSVVTNLNMELEQWAEQTQSTQCVRHSHQANKERKNVGKHYLKKIKDQYSCLSITFNK